MERDQDVSAARGSHVVVSGREPEVPSNSPRWAGDSVHTGGGMSLCVGLGDSHLNRRKGPKVPGSPRAVTYSEEGTGQRRLGFRHRLLPHPTCRAIRGPWRVSLRRGLTPVSLASDACQARAVRGAVAMGTGRGQPLPPGDCSLNKHHVIPATEELGTGHRRQRGGKNERSLQKDSEGLLGGGDADTGS